MPEIVNAKLSPARFKVMVHAMSGQICTASHNMGTTGTSEHLRTSYVRGHLLGAAFRVAV